VHQYGPHIFHTNSAEIWRFVQRYCEFQAYTNTPKARTKSGLYSLPFNMHTFEEFWGITDPEAALKKIYREEAKPRPVNLEEKAVAMVGRELYEELSLYGNIKLMLYAPKTLLSPWNNRLYTPIYFYVETLGAPLVPDNENITIDYLLPKEILEKNNVAEPEKIAVKNLIKNNLI